MFSWEGSPLDVEKALSRLQDLKGKEPDEITEEMKEKLAEAKLKKEKLEKYIQKNPSKAKKKKMHEKERKQKEKAEREKERERKKAEKAKNKEDKTGTPGRVTNRKSSADTPKTSSNGK